jgi:DivIVA domain-containing protein
VTSQGQRFRRRALRRGYKVDEVDAFLDRVEATLSGEQAGPPVGAQEVHDVVFRVRFGGYDEWQVDLHLDRVERQLAELEDRGRGIPAPDPMRDSLRGGLSTGSINKPQGMGAAMGASGTGRMAPPTERLPAPMRDDRMPQGMPQGMPLGMQQAQQPPQRQPMQQDPYGRYDEPAQYGQQQPPQPSPQQLPQRPGPQGYPPQNGGYDQPPQNGPQNGGYDQPPQNGGYDQPPPQQQQYDQRGFDQRGFDQGGYDQPGGFDGFEAGRHGKADMTAEIRMPRDPDPRGYGGPPPAGPPPMQAPPMQQGPPMQQPPMGNAPMSGPPGGYGPPQPQLPPPMGEPGGELYRVDQLRRTFQPRRFGSGYDPMQVDRLFEGILQAMTGRGPMPVPENELDMLQFGLVPGGYFEAEVDAALREVKDILLRRR